MVCLTELLYFEDCYLKEFDATVVKASENYVVLDKTAFYPEGGGQPSDTGKIGDVRVTKVNKRGDSVKHIISGKPPSEGEVVHCVLDWGRRYSHMKYHTAQHILSAIVMDQYDGKTTGNQLYSNRARIDFDKNVLDKAKEIEQKVNSVIEEERDINIFLISREDAVKELDPKRTRINLLPDSIKELRIVEIEGIDKTACAGTHVGNTGELNEFKITDTVSKGKERKRIEFSLSE